jgi:ABC-type enterochelin transport system substrate-binding protein
MMNQQPRPVLDSKKISEILTNMKKQMSQVEGEIATMKSDAMSSLFQNLAGMLNQIFGEKEDAEKKNGELQAIIDKIYQGHPDIKISMEEKPKEKKVHSTLETVSANPNKK